MSLLIIDNYDSFTYNLVHIVEQYTNDLSVIRNDEIALDLVDEYDSILISPGPGLPRRSGVLMDVLARYATSKRILGVCLGMQAIVEHFGGELVNLTEVLHGVTTQAEVVGDEDGLFHGVPKTFKVGHYHSWAVKADQLPMPLKATMIGVDNIAMAFKHEELDLRGVQFHPESVLTEHGKKIIFNWLGGEK